MGTALSLALLKIAKELAGNAPVVIVSQAAAAANYEVARCLDFEETFAVLLTR